MKEAKEESWKKYGEQISELCKHSPRNVYKSVKAMKMRDETYDPTTIINDQYGNPINKKNDIKTRWKEYFSELLNDNGCKKKKLKKNPVVQEIPKSLVTLTLYPPLSFMIVWTKLFP